MGRRKEANRVSNTAMMEERTWEKEAAARLEALESRAVRLEDILSDEPDWAGLFYVEPVELSSRRDGTVY